VNGLYLKLSQKVFMTGVLMVLNYEECFKPVIAGNMEEVLAWLAVL
tara:strand:- start:536 stop:673 length:138 start_codon:yes stop_codon:yes gene_type:complete